MGAIFYSLNYINKKLAPKILHFVYLLTFINTFEAFLHAVQSVYLLIAYETGKQIYSLSETLLALYGSSYTLG